MKSYKTMLAMLLAISAMVGCHKREVIESVNADSIQAVIEAPKDEAPQFHYMTSSISCQALGYNVSGQVRVCRDSVIWVSVSKFIELGRAKLTPDSIYVYAKVNNSYYGCPYGYLKSRFGVDVDYKSIQGMLVEKAQKPDGSQTIPIRSKELNTDVVVRFSNVAWPQVLSFPFAIPAGARKMSMSMFE